LDHYLGAHDRGLTGLQRALHPRRQLLLLAALVLIAFAIQTYRLGQFPDTVLGDEADNVQYAARILLGAPPPGGLFGVDWTPQPAFSVYKQALFIALFGFKVAALRLPSAVSGSLALIPFYFLVRRQLSITASLLATALLASNVWYLNFARSGWNNIDVCFYMLMAMLGFMLALDSLSLPRSRRRVTWGYFAAAGLFASLGLYAYPAGRATTLAFVGMLPIAFLLYWKRRRILVWGFALLFAVEVVTFAPQAAYVVRHWESFNGRTNVVLFFNQTEFKADPAKSMLEHVLRNLRGPWDGTVNNTPQYSPPGEPQLDAVTGALAFGGMLLTLILAQFRRNAATWLWWLMLLSGWFMTQVLTAGTPNGARGIGYMPTLMFFAAVGLDGLLEILRELSRSLGRGRGLASLLQAACAAAILLVCVANVRHYVSWQSKPQTRSSRYIYLTVSEFPRWADDVVARARSGQGVTNLGMWRGLYPIPHPANPQT
jgi:4-amino-4-deoxy-L-arabinose transferase-like glycosyltransferase